ncbi:MAG: LacI family transcriptional regulator [Bifidobacteriaceae bacterium]|nr:LacI family transcriptional regulator [Bifidobacteriaceae bacterium]
MARRTTIVDVARAAGVSLSTASVALNGLPGVSEAKREQIRRIARELSYSPTLRARGLAAKRAFAIGFVVERSPAVMSSDPFFGAFIAGVQEAIAGAGYVMVLQVSPSPEQAAWLYREFAGERRVDGVLLDQLRVDDGRIALVGELGLPAVAIAPPTVSVPLPLTSQSAAPGIVQLVEHLIALGHRDIAHIRGKLDYVHSVERREAWLATLARAGLPAGPELQGDFTVASGSRAAEAILAMERRPTAVVCVNDLCAIGLVAGLQAAGVEVPGEISVVGFDGIELANYLHPRLTTVRTAPETVGRAAAAMLLELIDEPGRQPWTVRLGLGPMVVGDSTAPPPAGR